MSPTSLWTGGPLGRVLLQVNGRRSGREGPFEAVAQDGYTDTSATCHWPKQVTRLGPTSV